MPTMAFKGIAYDLPTKMIRNGETDFFKPRLGKRGFFVKFESVSLGLFQFGSAVEIYYLKGL